MAVRRSPKNPDWDGLDIVMADTIDESGGVETHEFNKWLASQQKDQAVIMKGHRLLREELKRLGAQAASSATG